MQSLNVRILGINVTFAVWKKKYPEQNYLFKVVSITIIPERRDTDVYHAEYSLTV